MHFYYLVKLLYQIYHFSVILNRNVILEYNSELSLENNIKKICFLLHNKYYKYYGIIILCLDFKIKRFIYVTLLRFSFFQHTLKATNFYNQLIKSNIMNIE